MNQNSQTRVSPLMALIFRILDYVEIFVAVGTAVGFVMLYTGLGQAREILNITMSLLAATLFLRAYKPLDDLASQQPSENKPATGMFGSFSTNLKVLPPKALGIASSMGVIGILFWVLQMNGAVEM